MTTSGQVAQSWATQNGDDDPLERFTYTAPAGGTNDYAIVIDNYLGAALTRNLEVFIYPNSGVGIYANNIDSTDAVYGHPAIDEVVSVGAVRYNTPKYNRAFLITGTFNNCLSIIRVKTDSQDSWS